MKILIAEDNAFSRTLLKKTLTKAGYEVIAAENGDVAWEILQQDDAPKLALLDWMMPGISGIDLCRKIREIDSAIPLYMILLTAKSDKEDVLEGFAAGADDFIKKPFDSGELLARIQVGRRLVEQQALLYCLIDSIPDPIYVKDSRGLYLGCNSAYARFVGTDADQIYSRTASEVLPDHQAKKTHMEDLRVLANAAPIETEGWVTDAKGNQVYHETVKMPYLESAAGSTGMIGISRDLTKRMEMEQELRKLAVAVEQSTESIMITDVDGVIQYVNAAFETTSGYSQDAVIGKKPDLLQSDKHDAAFFDNLWSTISNGKTWAGELTNKKKDGTLYIEEAVIYPIRGEGDNMINYVAISRDITQEREIEKHLRQQQKMNAIGELAGGVSHDFNNILTAILGYVALCMNSVEEDGKVYGYLKEIVKAGDRATKLVRQILTFSRQEEQEFHSLELQSIIEDSLSMVQTTMKKSIVLEQDIDPACGAILGDTTQIQQVMINLCTNAAHALGEERSGKLNVSLKQVEILAGKSEDQPVDLDPGYYACITVADTGCGIPADVVERIFEPYFTTKKKEEGTGFGLSIVHGIVRKHRGIINVASQEGEGTTFTLYFPLLMDSVEKQEKAEVLSTPEGHGQVLFVDDDETVLSMGREILESYGYTVVTATNGRRALETFKLDPANFDVLVTDYSMPETNGHELIKSVLEIRADIPAILCSGYMEKVEGENLKDLGHAAYMAKPIDWRELSRTIQAEIRNQK
ncbi:response regulator [Pontiellaceae bacterium B12227]|nr:response regulator [Pontiellaceae bacterium B12227]